MLSSLTCFQHGKTCYEIQGSSLPLQETPRKEKVYYGHSYLSLCILCLSWSAKVQKKLSCNWQVLQLKSCCKGEWSVTSKWKHRLLKPRMPSWLQGFHIIIFRHDNYYGHNSGRLCSVPWTITQQNFLQSSWNKSPVKYYDEMFTINLNGIIINSHLILLSPTKFWQHAAYSWNFDGWEPQESINNKQKQLLE